MEVRAAVLLRHDVCGGVRRARLTNSHVLPRHTFAPAGYAAAKLFVLLVVLVVLVALSFFQVARML